MGAAKIWARLFGMGVWWGADGMIAAAQVSPPHGPAGVGVLAHPKPGGKIPHDRNRPYRGRPATLARAGLYRPTYAWMKSDARAAPNCWLAPMATWKSNAHAAAGLTFIRAPLSALFLSADERLRKRALMLLLKDRLRTEGEKSYIVNDAGIVVGFGDAAYHVKEIPSKLARDTIRAKHYSKTIVNNSYVNLGVFWRGDFVGCLQFGYAMNPNSGRRVVAGTENRQYLELNRMWVTDAVPGNGESMAIAYAIRFVRARYPGVQWIQSFADERCGRWGVVYQAANFQYLGFHLTDFWLIDGEWYHDLLVTAHKKGGGCGHFLRENLHRAERRRFRQFRYIRFLDRSARKRLLKPIVAAYPKPEAL